MCVFHFEWNPHQMWIALTHTLSVPCVCKAFFHVRVCVCVWVRSASPTTKTKTWGTHDIGQQHRWTLPQRISCTESNVIGVHNLCCQNQFVNGNNDKWQNMVISISYALLPIKSSLDEFVLFPLPGFYYLLYSIRKRCLCSFLATLCSTFSRHIEKEKNVGKKWIHLVFVVVAIGGVNTCAVTRKWPRLKDTHWVH